MSRPFVTSSIAAALLLTSGVASAKAVGACLTQSDFALMGTAILPTVLDGVAERCRANLPGTAALLQRDDAHWQALTAAAEQARPAATTTARALLARGDTPFPKELAKSADILTVGAAFVSSAIAEDLKPNDCTRIDLAYQELAPLPPANLFRVVSLLLMGDKKPLVCPVGTGQP